MLDRCLIAGRALWFYAGKLLWPHPLAFIYARWHVDAAVWWQYLFPLAAAATVAALHLARGRIGSGPLVAVLCYVTTLAPALGFVNVYPMRTRSSPTTSSTWRACRSSPSPRRARRAFPARR